MKFEKYKRSFIQILVASLIAAASLAVIAVLIGEFNDTLVKLLFTLGMVILHVLFGLLFLDKVKDSNAVKGLEKSRELLFILLVLSFFTSVLGIWDMLSSFVVTNSYLTYIYMLFSSYHAESLYLAMGREKRIDNIVKFNLIFIVAVFSILTLLTWTPGANYPDFIYRLFGALAIVDITLTILAIVYNKLFFQKHPEAKTKKTTKLVYDDKGNPIEVQQRSGMPLIVKIILWILGIYLLFQLFAILMVYSIGSRF